MSVITGHKRGGDEDYIGIHYSVTLFVYILATVKLGRQHNKT